MDTEEKDVAKTEAKEVETEQTELSVEDLKKELEITRLKAEQTEREKEVAKKSQAGSDRVVLELKKRLEALEKEKMTDEEKLKYAEQQAERVKQEYESKLREIELEKFVSQKVADIKIESRFSSLVEGRDEVTITEKTNLLIELLKSRDEAKDAEWRAKGGKPGSGTQMTSLGVDIQSMSLGQLTDHVRGMEPAEANRIQDIWHKTRKKQ